jgi:hypothetical protein
MKLATVVKIEKKKEYCVEPLRAINISYNSAIDELSKWEIDADKLAEALYSSRVNGAQPVWCLLDKAAKKWDLFIAKSILSRSSEWILRKEK